MEKNKEPRRIIIQRGTLSAPVIETRGATPKIYPGTWVEDPDGLLCMAYYSDQPQSAVTAWQPELAVKNLEMMFKERERRGKLLSEKFSKPGTIIQCNDLRNPELG